MKIGQMKTSKYIKKEDVGNGVVVTIHKIDQQDVSMENDPSEMKYILYFKEEIDGDHKGMVMNWTNIQLCARACGSEETDDWLNKQIELYDDPNVSFGGNLTGGIRIRAVSGQPVKPIQQSTQPLAETKTVTQPTPSEKNSSPMSENPAEGMEDPFK